MRSKQVPLPIPDISIHPVGAASAEIVGPMQLNLLTYFGLKPEHRMLDLGCGVGRLAYKIADYLTSGEYYGLDINRNAIDWLNENYASQLDNFHFDLLDVNNRRYNPKGIINPAQSVLPYQDKMFDMVDAFSLFTHMMPVDVTNYLSEIRRVLRIDGRAVVTFFSIESNCTDPPAYGGQAFIKVPDLVDIWTLNLEIPERGIAYSSSLIDKITGEAGLSISSEITGYWKGNKRDEPPFKWAHQDVFVLQRTA